MILLDVGLEFPGVETAVESRRVQSEIGGVLLQPVGRERLLILEQRVVVVPEPALRVSALRGLGRWLRPVV